MFLLFAFATEKRGNCSSFVNHVETTWQKMLMCSGWLLRRKVWCFFSLSKYISIESGRKVAITAEKGGNWSCGVAKVLQRFRNVQLRKLFSYNLRWKTHSWCYKVKGNTTRASEMQTQKKNEPLLIEINLSALIRK